MRISDWSSDVCSSDLVVALTGVINTLDEPLYASWQKGEVARLTAAWQGQPLPTRFGSIEQAVREAQAARPDLKPAFVSYPGTGYSGTHHYGVFMSSGSSSLARSEAQTSELQSLMSQSDA